MNHNNSDNIYNMYPYNTEYNLENHLELCVAQYDMHFIYLTLPEWYTYVAVQPSARQVHLPFCL